MCCFFFSNTSPKFLRQWQTSRVDTFSANSCMMLAAQCNVRTNKRMTSWVQLLHYGHCGGQCDESVSMKEWMESVDPVSIGATQGLSKQTPDWDRLIQSQPAQGSQEWGGNYLIWRVHSSPAQPNLGYFLNSVIMSDSITPHHHQPPARQILHHNKPKYFSHSCQN